MIPLLWFSLAQAAPIASAWVHAPDPAALSAWPVGFAESRDGDWVLVHGALPTLRALESAGFELRALQEDHRALLPEDSAGYHDAAGVEAALFALAEAHPDRCALARIGTSRGGRPIWALDIGPAEAPRVALVGGIHGDERVATELALRVATLLLEDEAPFAGLAAERRVRVIPALNPDGLEAGSRYNSADVDLNRNFGFHWTSFAFGAGEAPFSEPESVALRESGAWNPAALSLMFHAGETNIGYVWNWTLEAAPEQALLENLAITYAEATNNPDFWITQGSHWYITTGDSTDWSFGRAGTLDFTVELSAEKTPPAGELPALLAAHADAVAALLRQPIALAGRVSDARSGRPIPATLTLEDGSSFLNHPADGTWSHAQTAAGQTLTVAAPGYRPTTLPAEQAATVALEPVSLAALRPEPALIPAGAGLVEVRVPGAGALDPVVVLRRPGQADLVAEAAGESFFVDSSALVPGVWTIDLGDSVLPRALFSGSDSAAVGVRSVDLSGDTLAISGHDFDLGTSVFALFGEDRAWVPLPVLDRTEDQLLLDPSGLPGQGAVDLVVVSQGVQVSVLDLYGEPLIDEGPPPDSADSGGSSRPPPACACSAGSPRTGSPRAGALWAPWLAALGLVFRRRRCRD